MKYIVPALDIRLIEALKRLFRVRGFQNDVLGGDGQIVRLVLSGRSHAVCLTTGMSAAGGIGRRQIRHRFITMRVLSGSTSFTPFSLR
jgi:hypothetical protein